MKNVLVFALSVFLMKFGMAPAHSAEMRTVPFVYTQNTGYLQNVPPGVAAEIKEFKLVPKPGMTMWRSVYAEMTPRASQNVWFRAEIFNARTGEWYFMTSLRRGERDRLTFPNCVSTKTPIHVRIRCFNEGQEAASCDGYMLVSGD